MFSYAAIMHLLLCLWTSRSWPQQALHGTATQTANVSTQDPQMWAFPGNPFSELVAADHCLTERATFMTRLFGIVDLDVAGMESSTSPCQRSPNFLLSAPGACRVSAELAGWRLQHKGCQPHHANGEPAPAWPK